MFKAIISNIIEFFDNLGDEQYYFRKELEERNRVYVHEISVGRDVIHALVTEHGREVAENIKVNRKES